MQSTGDQLITLQMQLQEKLDVVNQNVKEHEEIIATCTAELKTAEKKLEEVEKRMNQMKTVRKEYRKTITETDFALTRIEENTATMRRKFANLQAAG